ncbi:MAG: tetratricopeptide repeat protein [Polyangiaceae bacterium]
MQSPMPGKVNPSEDTRDHRHWSAVEEASELLVERRFEDALKELKQVIERDPNNPYAYHLLGTALWELAQLEPARDAFRAATLVSPTFLGARVGLAHALRKLGDLGGAEREAAEALRRFPDDGEAAHAMGLVLAARGKRREARYYLERFLASKPEVEASMEARGVLEMLTTGEEDDPLDVDD